MVYTMFKIKNKLVYVVFTIVFLLIISSINSIAIKYDNQDKQSNLNNGIILKTRPETQKITFNNVYKSNIMFTTESDGSNEIQITNLPDDEYHPSLIVSQLNALVAYESKNTTDSGKDVVLKSSKNYGATSTWSEGSQFSIKQGKYTFLNDYNYTYPSLTNRPGWNKAYGSIVSSYSNSGVYLILEVANIGANNIEIDASILDWTNVSYNETTGNYFSFYDFSDANTIIYDKQDTTWVLALIGSTNYTDSETGEGPCTDTPMFSFLNNMDPTNVSIAWFPDVQHCANLSVVNQYGSSMIYGVCEIDNVTNQDLLFFKGNPNLWSPEDASLINKTITSSQNLLHPKIAVKDNNIYIVAENDTQGIVLYYSTDKGENWSLPINVTNDILPAGSKPEYPDIVVNETHLISTFIESGNLSIISSNNSGNTWSNSTKLNNQNNSVVSSYSYSDIGNSKQIAWTDNRNGNNDIYYYLGYQPTPSVTVNNFDLSKNIPFLPTNNIIEITLENQGDGLAEDVKVDIIYGYKNGSTITQTEFVPHISKFSTISVRYPMFTFTNPEYFQAFLNFSFIQDITVKTDEDELTKSIDYKDIFPILYHYETIFRLIKMLIG